MKINFTTNYNDRKYYNTSNKKIYNVNFEAITQKQYEKAQSFVDKYRKSILSGHSIFSHTNYSVYDLPPERINGIQKGTIFENEHIGDTLGFLEALRGFLITRGCTNQCGHCIVNAKPHILGNPEYINSMPWEDFVKFTESIKTLSDRFGTSVLIHPRKSCYSDIFDSKSLYLFLDSDGMDIALRDKNGNIHEFPEIVTKIYNDTQKRVLFDTSGWHYKNKTMQERAERYVRFFANPESKQKLYQINLSLNPFNSLYMKALELGYNPVKRTFSSQKAQNIYQEYINRIANMFVTFSPLIENPNFNILFRVLKNDVPNMQGFVEKDFKIVIDDIFKKVKIMLQDDLNNNKKYVNNKIDIRTIIHNYKYKIDESDTYIALEGRFKKLFRLKNPNMSEEEIKKFFSKHDYDILPRGIFIDINGDIYVICTNDIMKLNSQIPMSTNNKKTRPIAFLGSSPA